MYCIRPSSCFATVISFALLALSLKTRRASRCTLSTGTRRTSPLWYSSEIYSASPARSVFSHAAARWPLSIARSSTGSW